MTIRYGDFRVHCKYRIRIEERFPMRALGTIETIASTGLKVWFREYVPYYWIEWEEKVGINFLRFIEA